MWSKFHSIKLTKTNSCENRWLDKESSCQNGHIQTVIIIMYLALCSKHDEIIVFSLNYIAITSQVCLNCCPWFFSNVRSTQHQMLLSTINWRGRLEGQMPNAISVLSSLLCILFAICWNQMTPLVIRWGRSTYIPPLQGLPHLNVL